jgi:hypothetical protein
MGMATCNDCGATISTGATACPKCGSTSPQRGIGYALGAGARTVSRLPRNAMIAISAAALLLVVAGAGWNRWEEHKASETRRVATEERKRAQVERELAQKMQREKCTREAGTIDASLEQLRQQRKFQDVLLVGTPCRGSTSHIDALLDDALAQVTDISFGSSPELLQRKYTGTRCDQMPNVRVMRCFVPPTSSRSGTEESYMYMDGRLYNLNGRTQ